ncbi:MAG TPA: polyphenol oxidase family protein [Acidimicrobiales bacterium]|nr:polyphenol oxidase family protein [Acidimicrobiales bacterium]
MPAQLAGVGAPWRTALAGGRVEVACTGRPAGDLSGDGPEVVARRAAVVARRWVRLRQVHGADVRVVRTAADAGDPVAADAAVTDVHEVALAVLTADCAPIALGSPEGVVGVAHAGWRGLLAGVVGATVEAMAALGATSVEAVVGPCIEPACYEFSADDLAAAVARFGPEVEGRDRLGRPALDLPAGVAAALGRAGACVVPGPAICTACSADHWSWRARRDTARQATVAWQS